ncbi:MAG: translation elongation factor 4 [Actinomycetota bacterium]|nr:translation elongation factor 4 [Actinomycetota bacterium]
MNLENIRNFSIIAHIDHGKSTLADRLLEITDTLPQRDMKEQVLDRMDLERERGITIKAQAVKLNYRAADGKDYVLNLIDTPGHVDFTYEVSRSLAACEGALLVVDAAQGVEAQTVANAHLAIENNLEIIPVINKIDLPSADVARVKHEIEESLGIDAEEAILVSAKTGEGAKEVLEAVIRRIPPPEGQAESSLKALVFDSKYDAYRGVVVFVRVMDGSIGKGDKIKMMATGRGAEVEEVGVFSPDMKVTGRLGAGEVGYVIAGIKDVKEVKVGDTITELKRQAVQALPGYKEAKPMVFCGIYPVDGGEYANLRDALAKLQLNDTSLTYEPETSTALGFGFRCGFLGLLHLEIVKERLEREYELTLLATAPSVAFRVNKLSGDSLIIRNPSDFPKDVAGIEEPYIAATILAPSEFIGAIMDLCQTRRGQLINVAYLSEGRAQINYDLPLAEIVLDFYDQLKSKTHGYASFDYEHVGYRHADLVKLDILLAAEPVDAFSALVPKEKAYERGKALVEKLRQIIPRQMFEVAIQAAIGGRIIARESVKAKRKDVTAKCYGGDISRKRKLLEKQKEGKKRMKQVGRVTIPQEAFLAILKVEE